MPGERYTQRELTTMSRADFEIAAANNFEAGSVERAKRDAENGHPMNAAEIPFTPPSGADLTSATPTQVRLRSAVEPSDSVWISKRGQGQDFVCPSGQKCRLRALDPADLIPTGILDRITRLEGLADELVQRAEGAPPAKAKMPSTADFQLILDTLNDVIPLAVAEPKVYRDGDEEAPDGAIRVSDIDLEDRMAILAESLKGIKILDRFRNAG